MQHTVAELEALDVERVEVPRLRGGAKDPNDIAIGMDAELLSCSGAGADVESRAPIRYMLYWTQLMRKGARQEFG